MPESLKIQELRRQLRCAESDEQIAAKLAADYAHGWQLSKNITKQRREALEQALRDEEKPQ